jgi:hypothetical protein
MLNPWTKSILYSNALKEDPITEDHIKETITKETTTKETTTKETTTKETTTKETTTKETAVKKPPVSYKYQYRTNDKNKLKRNMCLRCIWHNQRGNPHEYYIRNVPKMCGYYRRDNNVSAFINLKFQYSIYLIAAKHDMKCGMTMIKSAFNICNYLHNDNTCINKVHILLNYKFERTNRFNKNVTPKRDHLHTWIVMRDQESQDAYNKQYRTTNNIHNELKNEIEPYKGDQIIELNQEQIQKVKDFHTIDDLFIAYEYNNLSETNSEFYIFIEYDIKTKNIDRFRISY